MISGLPPGYKLSPFPGIILAAPPNLGLSYKPGLLSAVLFPAALWSEDLTAMGKRIVLLLLGLSLLVSSLQGETLADGRVWCRPGRHATD